MHEASIMQSVFDLAFAQLPDDSAARIDRLRIRVGALAGRSPCAHLRIINLREVGAILDLCRGYGFAC
jgi:Zn finger protein HypA/HybF involved in hydrogenase expression